MRPSISFYLPESESPIKLSSTKYHIPRVGESVIFSNMGGVYIVDKVISYYSGNNMIEEISIILHLSV